MIKIYHQHNYRAATEEPQVDFTPMLDVIFILLIFNVLMIGGAQVYDLQVTLPKVPNEEHAAQEPAQNVLQLYADGSYAINGLKISTVDELKNVIHQHKQNPVVLACDDKANIANLLSVLKILQEAGVVTTDVLLKRE